MPAPAAEQFTIKRKFFKLFGAGFRIEGPDGKLVGYCKQKAFRLREDLRIYTDDSLSKELMRIGTRQIIDFGANYEVSLPDGSVLGSMRRKGLKSLLRDSWLIYDASGKQIGRLQDDSGGLAFLRRFVDLVALLVPQKFDLLTEDGRQVAQMRTHFNPFLYRLGISVIAPDDELDELMILAAGVLVAAIEGRQD
jgi:uncharacterized protein YxjI